MDNSYHIPDIMEELFLAWVPAPDSGQWPAYLREDPVRGYGCSAFARALPWACGSRKPAAGTSPPPGAASAQRFPGG